MRNIAPLCAVVAALTIAGVTPSVAADSKCAECHAKITPMIVKDFNRGVMSETMIAT